MNEELTLEDIEMMAAEAGEPYVMKAFAAMVEYVLKHKGVEYITDIIKQPESE